MKRIILLILCICSLAVAQDKPYRIINSFNAGQLSPLLNAREDLSKFHAGCSIMENVIPLPQGAAEKRPGTVYVAGSKSNTKVRLLPFEFSTDQSYAIEAGNQYFRFFTDNDIVYEPFGTEDLSAFDSATGDSSLVAHWLFNDNLATTAVLDDTVAGTHDGTASSNTSTITAADESGTANTAFDLDGTDYVTITDHANLSFGDGTDDEPFTFLAWIFVPTGDPSGVIVGKYETNKLEYFFGVGGNGFLQLQIYDESASKKVTGRANYTLPVDKWSFVGVTYNGKVTSGAVAGDDASKIGMSFYVNRAPAGGQIVDNEAGYVAMEDLTSDVELGSYNIGTVIWKDKIHNIAIFNRVLLDSEIASLSGGDSTTPYEIVTPYLTADLFSLKFKQSADVLYISHPSYEPRKLSRYADAAWTLDATDFRNGPFIGQNTDVDFIITPSAITGSITLTATRGNPFVMGTTAGHAPSGSVDTSKAQTGALFKLVQSLETGSYEEILSNNYTADQTEDVSWLDCGTIAKGVTWFLTTLGTWTGTLEVQRNYTIGASDSDAGWEQAFPFQSNDDRNASTSAEETVAAADYRVILTASGDAAEPCQVYFRISDTDHVGIVEITSVTNTFTATGLVRETLADTTATHRWSEGAWSNYRGWPRAVTFYEDRLTFGGNLNQPDTIWLSATGNYGNMEAGADDDEAIAFTLSSKQVNVIEWMVGKNNLIIGTSGAEWTLRGGTDEPLTLSNVKAEQQSSHGSANLQAVLASETVLFFQRGAEKMRELAYNWESDSYVAPEMTLLAPEVTGDGITSVDYQKIPTSMLWCTKENGEMAVFVYERAEQVTSWSRFITDGLFESVIVINGDPEDQVWVSVNRTIQSTTKRYIEYFSARDFGSDVDDAFFVDSGITYDSTPTTTITGLDHLEAEFVTVLSDGAVPGVRLVSSGQITIPQASTVQTGLPFIVQMKTMPLSFVGASTSILSRVKRVSGLTAEYYNSGDFDYGKDATNRYTISVDGMDSDITVRKTFPAGYTKRGQVFIYQQSPEPFTLVSLGLDFEVF